MRTKITHLFMAVFAALLLNSCAVSKISNVQEIQKSDVETTVKQTEKTTENAVCFVQLNDGTTQNYSTLKLVTGVFTSPYLLADGKIKIQPSSVKAYRDANYYAISQKEFYTKGKAHVATHVLPGFAIRVVKGNINLYALQFYGSGNIYKKYFLQNGTEGKIVPFTADLLTEYTNNNAVIKNVMSKNKKKINNKLMMELVDNYNTTTSLSKN